MINIKEQKRANMLKLKKNSQRKNRLKKLVRVKADQRVNLFNLKLSRKVNN
jgi:hypothetical protein